MRSPWKTLQEQKYRIRQQTLPVLSFRLFLKISSIHSVDKIALIYFTLPLVHHPVAVLLLRQRWEHLQARRSLPEH